MTDSATRPLNTTLAEADWERRSLADEYRPDRFEKVVGQKSAVACLSGLIARGRKGRHVLLHGAVGSGKTTLARIYARALNCQAANAGRSPCYDCDACGQSDEDPIAEFVEFNIKNYGSGENRAKDKEEFAQLLKVNCRAPEKFKYRILFFDEAHALTKEQCDALLQPIENPAHPVVFLFATTEAEKLGPALRSRLFDILIRPLPIDLAIVFLTDVAKEEEIAHEPGALALLASLRTGFPRDLLLGLERVWQGIGTALTVEQVRCAFDIDQTEIVTDYFAALADGDRYRASTVASRWQEKGTDKIRWIQAFLLHVYHNDILGRRLIVDGGIESIAADARTKIVQRFQSRLGLTNPIALAPFWRRLMGFWPMPETAIDETALGLRIAMFHNLVAVGGDDLVVGAAAEHESASLHGWQHRFAAEDPAIEVIVSSSGFGPPPALRPDERVVEDEAGFLRKTDVRRIVNGASFLVQEHGLLFNSAFEIRPAWLGVAGREASVATIAAFRTDLSAEVTRQGGEMYVSMTVLERVDGVVTGRLVAHLRMPGSAMAGEADEQVVETWARTWRNQAERAGGDAVEVAWAPREEPAALKFHWRNVLALCAGLDPMVEAWDPALGEHRSLLKLLRVRTGRETRGQVKGHPLVEVSDLLSDTAIAIRCGNRFEPLSAFDDGAWNEVTSGWELEECDERRRLRIERARRLAEVRRRLGPATPEACAEIARIVASWPSDPRRRRRRWCGWRAGRSWP